jgi:hypothetical protein
MKVRINDDTVHLYSLACFQHSTIQVWGLFRLFTFRFYHNLLENRRNGLHTFFYLLTIFLNRSLWEVVYPRCPT